LDFESGYSFFEDSIDEWIYGFAAGWPISDRLKVLAELSGIASRTFGTDQLILNFGARQSLREIHLHHDLGIEHAALQIEQDAESCSVA